MPVPMFGVPAGGSSGMSAVGSVEVFAPLLDDDSDLLHAVKDFTVQAFVAQLAVEGFAAAVFPWAPGAM
jgi:hypothetical protein